MGVQCHVGWSLIIHASTECIHIIVASGELGPMDWPRPLDRPCKLAIIHARGSRPTRTLGHSPVTPCAYPEPMPRTHGGTRSGLGRVLGWELWGLALSPVGAHQNPWDRACFALFLVRVSQRTRPARPRFLSRVDGGDCSDGNTLLTCFKMRVWLRFCCPSCPCSSTLSMCFSWCDRRV
jgi:hypothetical protein